MSLRRQRYGSVELRQILVDKSKKVDKAKGLRI
jgi:hypothetical protein